MRERRGIETRTEARNRDDGEGRTREGCGSGPAIINQDWPMGQTTAATWLDEHGPLGAPGEKNSPGETMPPRLGVVNPSFLRVARLLGTEASGPNACTNATIMPFRPTLPCS